MKSTELGSSTPQNASHGTTEGRFSDRERETARMGYQYGDHTSRTKVSPRSIM